MSEIALCDRLTSCEMNNYLDAVTLQDITNKL